MMRVAIAVALAAGMTGGASADPAAGHEKAAMCATCHGMDGIGTNPEVPHIAGESEIYLMAQLHGPDEVFGIWRDEMDGIVGEGGVFTLTCHPSVIGRHHRMNILDRLVDHAEARGDVWIAPLEEIAGHVMRRKAAA